VETELKDVGEEAISFQVFQRLSRIENVLASLDARVDERLSAIEARLNGAAGRKSTKVVETKPNVRNMLMAMMQKGWVSETEMISKTGEVGTPWQTIGVRSFVTKMRTLGIAVETEQRDGVPYYRIAK
jgi:hypothetical protein